LYEPVGISLWVIKKRRMHLDPLVHMVHMVVYMP
jgi:hypothetical protein